MTEPIGISDHAVLRYLERAKGLDVEAIKAEMIPERMRPVIEQMRTGRYTINSEYQLIVENGVVVTVYFPKPLPKYIRKHKRS